MLNVLEKTYPKEVAMRTLYIDDVTLVQPDTGSEGGGDKVGRYPAMDLESQTKTWQWFIHRKKKQSKDQLE